MPSSGPAPTPSVQVIDFEVDLAVDVETASPVNAAAPVHIVALSDDPMLLEALHGASQSHTGMIISPTADRFVDQLVATTAGIALIDASSAPTPLKAFIALLREQFPLLLLIVAGPATLQAQLTGEIAAGTIFRFVHKPASSQRLKLFIDAALRGQQPPALDEAAKADDTAPAAEPESRAGLPWGRLALAVLSVALAAAAIAWGITHHASALAP
jgi:hypothetical protein